MAGVYDWPDPEEDPRPIPVRTELAVIPGDAMEVCPLCGPEVWNGSWAYHCRRRGDAEHLMLDVMGQ